MTNRIQQATLGTPPSPYFTGITHTARPNKTVLIAYWFKGKMHRMDGFAVRYSTGNAEYFIKDYWINSSVTILLIVT